MNSSVIGYGLTGREELLLGGFLCFFCFGSHVFRVFLDGFDKLGCVALELKTCAENAGTALAEGTGFDDLGQDNACNGANQESFCIAIHGVPLLVVSTKLIIRKLKKCDVSVGY